MSSDECIIFSKTHSVTIIFGEINDAKNITGPVFSNRQMLILNQCVTAANVIYKELITKPK